MILLALYIRAHSNGKKTRSFPSPHLRLGEGEVLATISPPWTRLSGQLSGFLNRRRTLDEICEEALLGDFDPASLDD